MISIIIRTKNEERWIVECLKKIDEQIVDEAIEIILVDNRSEDETVNKALAYRPDIKVVYIDEYKPGRAINMGVEASSGEYFAVLSAHCLPQNNDWLQKLRDNMNDSNVAGVYGRQIPMNYTPDVDKRDLLVTFGMDRIVQKRGTFFHNANSMVRRSLWEQFPFEDEITNIEDRIWGKTIISEGYHLVYEPDAAVFHYHGIHQKNNHVRLNNIIRIFDEFEIQDIDEKSFPINLNDMKIAAVLPFRSKDIQENSIKETLFKRAYRDIKKSKYINKIILYTDDAFLIELSEQYDDVETLVKRTQELKGTRLAEVFKKLLQDLAAQEKYYPDIVLPVELIYPFRPENLFDDLILKLIHNGFDTVVPGYEEYRACWKKNDVGFKRLDNHEVKRQDREPLHIGVLGLGFAVYPELLRKGIKYGDKLGLIQYNNPLIKMEIRHQEQMKYFDYLLNTDQQKEIVEL